MRNIAKAAERDYREFSTALAMTMATRDIGVRGVAEAAGVSPATVCRATQGKEIYAGHYLALRRWMGAEWRELIKRLQDAA